MADQDPASSNTKPRTFKPRAGIVRKSKAERDAHAQQEAERAVVRAAAAAHAVDKSNQTTKGSVQKKFGVQKSNRDANQGVAGGVFGAGSEARPTYRKSDIGEGYSEAIDGSGNAIINQQPSRSTDGGPRKIGGTSPERSRKIKKTREEAGSLDDNDEQAEPEERNRDIERIWISSDEYEEDSLLAARKGKVKGLGNGSRAKPSNSLRPIRATKIAASQEHPVDEKKSTAKTTRAKRTGPQNAEVGENIDDTDIDDESQSDVARIKDDAPSSPELSKRTKPGRKAGSRTKDHTSMTETVEEKAERLLLHEDVEDLREEFITRPQIETEKESVDDDRPLRPDRRLYLFQFPPLVPFLIDQHESDQVVENGAAVKSDPDGPDASASVKHEVGKHQGPLISHARSDGILTANEPAHLPTGLVGKLRIHKSGKVTLDWGGTDMEVRHGTEVDFLQDAVLVQTPAINQDGPEQQVNGMAYSLGQIQKKMLVVPDWQKLYD